MPIFTCNLTDQFIKELIAFILTHSICPDLSDCSSMIKNIYIFHFRMTGVRAAKESILTFLDSHVEVAPGWLPPLIKTIQTDRKVSTPCLWIESVFIYREGLKFILKVA